MNEKKALIIAYKFPPVNEIAAVRLGKFAKYLPEFGWQPIIITSDLPKLHPQTLPLETDTEYINRVPYFHWIMTFYRGIASKQVNSLSNKIDHAYSVRRSILTILRTLRPIYSLPLIDKFVFDPNGWYLPAIKTGMKIIKENEIKIIFSSYSPSTSHLIARYLHKATGIPWVAEYRDLWAENPYSTRVQPFFWFEQILEKEVLKPAHSLIAVSEPMSQYLETFHSKKVTTIHNGFDESDYAVNASLTTKFTITYTGKLVRDKRDALPLFIAISELKKKNLISSSNFEVRFFGDHSLDTLIPLIRLYNLNDIVKIYGFVAFKESIQRQMESTVLLLLSWIDPREIGVYTGKIFEYIGARRAILSIGRKGDVIHDLLTRTGTGVVCSNSDEIISILSNWLAEFDRKGDISTCFSPDDEAIRKYTRKEATCKLVNIFNIASNKK